MARTPRGGGRGAGRGVVKPVGQAVRRGRTPGRGTRTPARGGRLDVVLGSLNLVSPGLVQTRRAVFGDTTQQETEPTGDHVDMISVDDEG